MSGAATAFGDGLGRFGGRPALVDGAAVLSYVELDERVTELCRQLGGTRRLLLVEAANDVGSVVAYLAALRGRHPAMVVPAGGSILGRRLLERYDPDAVLAAEGGRTSVVERRPGSAHRLHPDLALLLSTSGSTGSPRLARLSHDNVRANAEAIAAYLELDGDDVTQTSLPLHYCYGLSVLNSHLSVGAAVVLSSASVVDPCFWASARANGVTNLAGVPHTFELLDHAGTDALDLPSLRFVTQAGGRLDPASVRRYAELGRDRGWRLFVMYGQTEATARMAYLPPDLAAAHPTAIGIPIPGGAFDLDPVEGGDELVYRGPNVMLGYAEDPADLALGRTVHELRTGDLARRTPGGLYEIVGRRSRFVKLFGLRIDLDATEQLLAAAGHDARCTGDDRGIVVALHGAPVPDAARRAVVDALGIPASAVAVVTVEEVPRLATGKVDYPAILRLRPQPAVEGATDVRSIYAELLHLTPDDIGDTDTFVALGGDSLSYVEATVRLQALLGAVPADWHLTPVAEVVAPRTAGPATLDTTVVLRALGIIAVVVSHATALEVRGGAHLLLAVTGFNFARFQLAAVRAGDGVRSLWRSIGRVAVPGLLAVVLLQGGAGVRLAELAFVTTITGAPAGQGQWHHWYLEVLVQSLVLLALALGSRRVRALERAHSLGVAAVVAAAGLAVRFDLLPLPDGAHPRFQVHNLVWLFALGWLAERCTTARQRGVLTVVAAVALHGFFRSEVANGLVLAGFLVLTWLPRLPAPRPLHRPLATVAGASLLVYLTHWEVLRRLDGAPAAATVAAALAVGIALTAVQRWRPRRLSGFSSPPARP